MNREDKEFYGTMEGDKFRIVRFIVGRYAYRPQITVSIDRSSDGTYLNLKMSVHPIVVLAMFLFFALQFLIPFLTYGSINLIWPSVVIVLHFIMYYFNFLPEAKKN